MSVNLLAENILTGLGGAGNILNLTHCATRLRIRLADTTKCNDAAIKQINGVLGTVTVSGQYQLIIGHQVATVYQALQQLCHSASPGQQVTGGSRPARLPVFDIISGSFLPLLGLMAAGGLLKVILTVTGYLSPATAAGNTCQILAAIANCPFYFLPVLLGCSLARRLGANPFSGLIIGAALLDPVISGIITQPGSSFASLPLVPVSYAGSVFPVFIAVTACYWLEKLLLRIIPLFLQLALVPMLSLIIIIPATLLIFGPFGIALGEQLALLIGMLQNSSGLLCGLILGAGYTFIVLFGLHWGLVPVILANLASGGDPLYAIGGMAAFAQIGVAAGVLVSRPPKELRVLLSSALLPAMISGVTEPIIYGLMLPFRRLFLYTAIASAIGGAINGYFGVQMVAYAFASLPAIPAFTPVGIYLVSVLVTVTSAAIMVLIFGYRQPARVQGEHHHERKTTVS